MFGADCPQLEIEARGTLTAYKRNDGVQQGLEITDRAGSAWDADEN